VGRLLSDVAESLPDTRLRLVRQDASQLRSDRFRELASLAVSDLVAIVHPGHAYRDEHLIDLFGATRFAQADVIGSSAVAGVEHQYVDAVHPHSAIARREVITTGGWQDEAGGAELRARFRAGTRFYALPRDTFTPRADRT
jgi:hypothetical protein